MGSTLLRFVGLLVSIDQFTQGWVVVAPFARQTPFKSTALQAEEWSDFADYDNDFDDDKPLDFGKLLQDRTKSLDYTAIQTRQFSLGKDLVVNGYVGSMGFDEGGLDT